jgi:DNA-binding NarL/FixJ family response regulator
VLGADELVVLSYEHLPFGVPPELTEAEVSVVSAALEGLSNRAIARRRRVSARTIANQLASAYRKLGISGRAELAFRCAGGRR